MMPTFDSLFDSFSFEAFRLETLPAYFAEDEALALAAFTSAGSLPAGFGSEWAELISSALSAGKAFRRLRIIDDPLTTYERFELNAAYHAGLDAGEDIRLIPRSDLGTATVPEDFWLFDRRWLVLLNYGSAGEYLGEEVQEVADLPANIVRWIEAYDSARPIAR